MSASTQPTPPLLAGRNIVQVALTTRDQERSKAFYRDVLGLLAASLLGTWWVLRIRRWL